MTESELAKREGITRVKTSLAKTCVEVTGDFGEQTPEQIMSALSEVLQPHGYTLALEPEAKKTVRWSEFMYAVPAALLFIAGFILLQKLGIVNLVDASEVTYGTAFVVGMVASVSTCMAVVGGMVLSISASYAKEGDAVRPQTLFHVGRLVSFFVLGGLIGVLGSVFQFGVTGTLVLGVLVALVLLILGLNLLDIFPWMKRFQLSMPAHLGSRVQALKTANHVLTPLLIGVLTFVLPCGFTQSMQIYTLTTGSFLRGGFTMLAFALGTLPVLALLSFSALGIQKNSQSGVFFKAAGLVVIFFAIFNLLNTFVGAGIMNPIFTL